MHHDYFSNFARRNCTFVSDAVPVHRVVRAVEFKMATGCKFLSLAANINSVSFLSKIIFVLRTVNDGFLVMKSVCDIVRRFMAVFYTCYGQS